jgi:hypothetical protein
MTASRLQSIAMLLSRSCYVRHWLHFNYPQQEPWLMAISVKGAGDQFNGLVDELTKTGFTLAHHEGLEIFTVPRTTEAGKPYRSSI